MRRRRQSTASLIRMKGSLTVEAAIVIPVVLLCVLWIMEAGIALYGSTLELVQKQEMWEEFQPAVKFRRLELLGDLLDALS